MAKRPYVSQAQLKMLASIAMRLRRAGVPTWLLMVVGAVLLLGVLLWPAVQERLGGNFPLPETPPTTQPAPQSGSQPPAKPAVSRSDGPGDSAAELTDFFTESKRGVFESPAGLRYRPGSAQGHRLKHVLAHAHDQPKRAGPHGVFGDSDPRAVFALVDEAFQQAESGVRTRTRRAEGRTIHTVDLGRRIGYVGGESGNARGRPAARRLRLVLDGPYVITAYPVR